MEHMDITKRFDNIWRTEGNRRPKRTMINLLAMIVSKPSCDKTWRKFKANCEKKGWRAFKTKKKGSVRQSYTFLEKTSSITLKEFTIEMFKEVCESHSVEANIIEII